MHPGTPAGRHIAGRRPCGSWVMLEGVPILGPVGWRGFSQASRYWELGGAQNVHAGGVTSHQSLLQVVPLGTSHLAHWDNILGLGVGRPSRPGGVGVQRDHVAGKACPWGSRSGP